MFEKFNILTPKHPGVEDSPKSNNFVNLTPQEKDNIRKKLDKGKQVPYETVRQDLSSYYETGLVNTPFKKIRKILLDHFASFDKPMARISCLENPEEYKDNAKIDIDKLLELFTIGSKTLDLCCGRYSYKKYLRRKNLPGSVTGVDIKDDEDVDVVCDVRELPSKLIPEQQFDTIIMFGLLAGTVDPEMVSRYLNDTGVTVSALDPEHYQEAVSPILDEWEHGKIITASKGSRHREDFVRMSKYFQPFALLFIKNTYYLFCRKK